MNGIAILILALIGGGVGASSQGPGDWIKYNSPKGRYSILVPGEPSLSTKENYSIPGYGVGGELWRLCRILRLCFNNGILAEPGS